MKHMMIVSLLVVFAVFSFAVWAEGPMTPATHEMDKSSNMTARSTEVFRPEILKAKDLIGMKVENPKAEELGTIADIVLTRDRNRVAFAVLSMGGAMGLGEKYYAIPWAVVSRTPESKVLILNKDKAALQKAPGFDKNNWPDMAKTEWARIVHEFYGQKHEPEAIAATATGGSPTESRRISKLLDINVKNRQGQTLGEIRDIAIDTHRGDVVYGILSLSTPVATTGAEMAAVPWTSLAIDPATRTAELSVDRSVLDAVAFRGSAFPNLAEREFTRRTYEQFNRQPYWDVLGYTAPGMKHRAGPGMVKQELHPAWAADSTYNRKFEPAKVTTIKGSVESVGSFVPDKGARPGVEVSVRTDAGKVVTVQLGPHSFMRTESMLPAIGDQIEIKGSMADVNGQNVCLACEIEKGGVRLQLRDSQGLPAWENYGSLRVRRTMEPKY